ncbi:hypothetical protein [Tissierella sp.]|uniref:hypothetical protein n=1 Tax=Tissierella sp. TaxID=41274 RepID=UPI00286251A6|nr:hypothetical protein [Tissierella sp.]MDR7857546.1 hypothetical protein [Tissierella sp.]
MKKILCVTYGGGHVQIAVKVIKELMNRNIDVQVLALTTSVFTLRDNNITYKGVKDYIDIFKDKDEILEIGSRLIDNSYNEKSGLDKEELIAYIGMNIYDLKLQNKTLEIAEEMFEKGGRQIFFPYHTIKQIVKQEQPDVVFLTCGQRTEKAAGIVADELNIPVVRVIDLLGEDDIIPYRAKVAVMNEMVKRNILNNNKHLHEEDIIVTGQPNIEIVPDNSNLRLFNQRYKIKKHKNIISMFSQLNIDGRDIVIKEMIRHAKSNNDNLYFYKLHPSESTDYYLDYIKDLPKNFIFDKNIDLAAVLYFSDIAMTFFSTVGLQVVAMDKPLITINLTNREYGLDYSKYNCSVEINHIKNLEYTIKKLLDKNSELSNRLKKGRKCMVIPKNSVENIADLISNI